MTNPQYLKWRHKINNKMPYHGDTDYEKKLIQVNKKRAKTNPTYKRPVNKGASKYPELLDTIVHEHKHKASPKMSEKNVRKFARLKVQHMGRVEKRRLYSMYK